jgi:hypothetical protein
MLVFLSDLHLTDGTCGPNLHPGAFHILAERLRYLAARASWRAGGGYQPVERIDLVLLGDVFDLIRSERWLQRRVKPWDDTNSPEMVQTVAEIADQIAAVNEPSLQVLRSLVAQNAVWVAPAARNGQPVYNAPPLPVSVRIFYMVGNHDWMLHLRGQGYDMVRQRIVYQMGLANPPGQPFPHDPAESDVLLETLRRHRVMARHGDVFDPLHFNEDRSASSLGDAIVVQLINRFAFEVCQQLQHDASPALRIGLRELQHIRPVLLAPVWIEGVLERSCANPAVRKHVKQIWDGLADELLDMGIVRDCATWSPVELIDGLGRALKFSQRLSAGWAAKIAAWLNGQRGVETSSYYPHALAEPDFRNRRARHIVYGHTHQPETVPLDASHADGYVLNQVYFNCGTWRRSYQLTRMPSNEHEFIPAENMTLVSFFEGDERGGRPFEQWTGMLGVGTEEPARPQRAVPRANLAIHPATTAPRMTPPHFAGAPQRRPIKS